MKKSLLLVFVLVALSSVSLISYQNECYSFSNQICKIKEPFLSQFIQKYSNALVYYPFNPGPSNVKFYREICKRLSSLPVQLACIWVDQTPVYNARLRLDPAELQGFVLYGHEEPRKYEGKMDPQLLFRWAIKNTFNLVNSINDEETLEKYSELKIVLLLINPDQNEQLLKEFLIFSRELLDVNIIHSSEPFIAERFNVAQSNAIVVIRNFDNSSEVYPVENGGFDAESVFEFVRNNRRMEVKQISSQSFSEALNWREHLVILGSDQTNNSLFEEFGNIYNGIYNSSLADSFANIYSTIFDSEFPNREFYVNFFHFEFSSEFFEESLRPFFGEIENPRNEPLIFIIRNDGYLTEKYLLRNWTPFSLKNILKDLDQRILGQFYKSKFEIKQKNLFLRNVSGNTFENLIIENKAHVLLFIFSGNCESCQKILEILEIIAEQFRILPGFKVFQMNQDFNEHVSVEGIELPNLLFYNSNNKMEPEIVGKFETIEDFEEFLEVKGIMELLREFESEW